MSYKYKSADAAVVKAVQDHYARLQALAEATRNLGKLFGGKGITCTSGDSTWAYGIEFADMPRNTPHWTKPSRENKGYLSIRKNPVLPKGLSKEEREAIKVEHARLIELWKSNEPERVNAHDTWEAIGVKSGMRWLTGGVMFEHDGVAYFEMGFQLKDADTIHGSIEITSSEYEQAKHDYNAG